MKNSQKQLTEWLANLGLPRGTRGFDYIRSIVGELTSKKNFNKIPTMQLYTIAAKQSGVSEASVERDIRYLLHKLWEADSPIYAALFGDNYKSLSRPTSGQFIDTLMDEYRLTQ